MNLLVLQAKVQKFIEHNVNNNLTKIILKGSPFQGISPQELATQIVGKNKASKKLPTWFSNNNIYYPTKLNIEQTSSEITAKYKATLVSGENIIDITGGFGVDCFAFSKRFKKVVHCEINQELSEIVAHNFKEMAINNVAIYAKNGLEFLHHSAKKYDAIYIDPSRRNDAKGKVFLLNDCHPNVPEHLDFLLSKSNQILIKNSPLLDISQTIAALKFVKEIHIVAINNDVKELLFLIEKKYEESITIKTLNFHKNKPQHFKFTYQQKAISSYSKPLTYLYEPNAALLKSGGFHAISAQLHLDKIHQHAHLYTSKNILEEFPGRKFKITHTNRYHKKEILKHLTTKKANITTRNFPKTVAQIRKELHIKDGGTQYLFFTTDIDENLLVIFCEQLF